MTRPAVLETDPAVWRAEALAYIEARVRAGHQVTAMVGSWTPRPDGYAYQWYRNGVAKPGKTDKAYTLNLGDRGQRISVRVTARRTGSAAGAKTSASITPR